MAFEKPGKISSIGTNNVPDLSLEHLRAEFARIDLLLQRAVRRWQLAGQDQADAFRGLYVADAEVDHLMQRPFGSNWGEIVRLPEFTLCG